LQWHFGYNSSWLKGNHLVNGLMKYTTSSVKENDVVWQQNIKPGKQDHEKMAENDIIVMGQNLKIV
jgi:hypothetical protein